MIVLLTAGIAATTTVFVAYQARVWQRESEFRRLLVAQLAAVRMMGERDAQQKLRDDFVAVLQSYMNLRSAYRFPHRRRKIKLLAAWRAYKGNDDEFSPFFGPAKAETAGTSIRVTTRFFDRNEIIANIGQLLESIH